MQVLKTDHATGGFIPHRQLTEELSIFDAEFDACDPQLGSGSSQSVCRTSGSVISVHSSSCRDRTCADHQSI